MLETNLDRDYVKKWHVADGCKKIVDTLKNITNVDNKLTIKPKFPRDTVSSSSATTVYYFVILLNR